MRKAITDNFTNFYIKFFSFFLVSVIDISNDNIYYKFIINNKFINMKYHNRSYKIIVSKKYFNKWNRVLKLIYGKRDLLLKTNLYNKLINMKYQNKSFKIIISKIKFQ